MKKVWNMFLSPKGFLAFVLLGNAYHGFSQKLQTSNNLQAWEVGAVYASAEATYYGVYGKYTHLINLTSHHSFMAGFSITSYADFTGESEPNAIMTNDIDMRLIPAFFVGYNFAIKKLDFSLEFPLGSSIAITRGTLQNDLLDIDRSISNTEFLWHYGALFSTKFKILNHNKLTFLFFYPLGKDIAWSLPYGGIGWTFGRKDKN